MAGAVYLNSALFCQNQKRERRYSIFTGGLISAQRPFRQLPDLEHNAGGEPRWNSHHQGPLLGQIPEAEGIESGDVGGEHPRLVLQRAIEQYIAVAHAHGFRLGVV